MSGQEVSTPSPQCDSPGHCEGPVLVRKKNSTKDYSDTVRVFDSDGMRLRADAICVRDTHKQEVLLVSSRNWEGQWTIPGGGLEPNETKEEAALREAMEEAGVEGTLHDFVGSFDNEDNRTRTNVFTMIVSKEVEQWRDKRLIGRQRKWFSKEEAISMIKMRRPQKCKYLEAACNSKTNTLLEHLKENPVDRTSFKNSCSGSCLCGSCTHCNHDNTSNIDT